VGARERAGQEGVDQVRGSSACRPALSGEAGEASGALDAGERAGPDHRLSPV